MFGKLARISRHPLRGIAYALAAFCLAWGIALTEGLVASMIGAIAGLVLGERLGKSRLRLSFALGALALVLLLSWVSASIAVSSEIVPSLIGPGWALRGAGVLRYGLLSLSLMSSLRMIVVRKPQLLALELGFIVAAIATVFAGHRDGIIARPLWLSDWAWQNGIDPTNVLLFVGGASVVILAILLVAESKSDLSLASLAALLALAILAVACLDVVGMPTPVPENDLGLTPNEHGDPPRNPPSSDGGRPRQPGDNADGGRGGQGNGGDGGADGDGDGGAGGGGDGGGSAGQGDGGSGSNGGDGGGDGGGGGGQGDGGSSSSGQTDGGDGGGQQQNQSDGGGSSSQQPQSADGGNMPPPQQQQQPREQDPDVPNRSPAPMAIVIFDDDYSPPSQLYYFRQDSWSEYNGSRLVATTRTDTDLDILRDFPAIQTTGRDQPPRRGRTTVSGRVAMLVQHNNPFALETPIRWTPTANPNPQRFVRAYRFASLAQTIDYRRLLGKRAGDRRWTAEQRAYYLRTPEDPRYRELEETIVRTIPPRHRNDPFARALAIKLWLDDNLIYSTRHRHAGVADPTADFLFGNKTGYCVHFAHSAVYLFRLAGVPARIGTGYATDEANRQGGSALLIRGSDAHAWPEIYLEGLGWIVLDISAKQNLDPPGQPADDDLQQLLGEMAREEPPDPMQPPQKREPPRNWQRALGIGGIVIVLAVLLLLYGVKFWRRLAPALASARTRPRVAYRAALDVLAEAGLKREEGESREAFAERVRDKVPSFEKLTTLHVAARLRPTLPDTPKRPEYQRSEWSAAMSAMRRELRRATRFWRRLVGLLHPTSFLDSR